jgi:hypothetical protein
MEASLEWLQKCVEHYWFNNNDLSEAIGESEDLKNRTRFYNG